MDEFRFWSDERTAGEIKDNYNRQLTGSETDLALYYRFHDDATQTTIKDLSPNANDGTLTNGGEIIRTLGKAMKFDGVNDVVRVADAAALDLTSAVTLEAWIKPNDIVGTESIVGKGASYTFKMVNAELHFAVFGDGKTTSSVGLTANAWQHVAVTFSNADKIARFYVDGAFVEQVAYANPLIASDIVLDIGALFGTTQYWNGQIDDVRVWSTVRTASEIADNYNQELSGAQPGLVGNWHFDEIVGTTVFDTAGSNNGTVINGATIVDTAPDVFGTAMTIAADEAAMGEMTAADVIGTATYSVSGGTVASGVSTKATTNGSVSIDQSSGAWTYMPNAKFDGTETFILTATGATSGTDNETITITVTDPQVAGGSLQFDGSNDFVALTNNSNSLVVNGTGTIELWLAPPVWNLGSGFHDLISIGKIGTTNGALYLSLHSAVGLTFRYGGSSETNNKFLNYQNSDSFTDGAWHHVAASWSSDGSTTALKLYVDGNLVDTDATALVINDTDPNWALGKFLDAANNQAYKGQIDEVRIWSTARTDGEIKDNYNQQLAGTETGLKAYYQLNDVKGTVVQDKTSNNNDGVIDGGSGGPIANVLSLDGTNDYLSVADTAELDVNSNFTIETWINLDTVATRQVILNKGNAYLFAVGAGGKLSFIAVDGVVATDLATTSAHVSAGAWTHVAVVFDASQDANFYVNGVLVETVAGTTTIQSTADVMDIGRQSAGLNQLNGKMDNLRIWNDVRTAAELADGMTRTYDYDEAGLVAQYTFDDFSGTTVRDTAVGFSGVPAKINNSDGTLTNGASLVDGGGGDAMLVNIGDKALTFDGTGDTVTFAAPVAPTGTAARTMMLWAKTSSTGLQEFFSYGTTTTAGGFGLGINPGDGVGEGKGITVEASNIGVTFQPVTDPSDGQWHHYAVTMAAGANIRDVKVYQDGVLLTGLGLLNGVNSQINTASGNMKLGEWFAGKLANFNGQMSEFSVWNTALTTAQINDYMTQSLDGDETNLTGYWRLDEGAGTTINDQTTNNNDGTLAGNTTWVDTAPDILGSTVQLAEGTSASGRMTGVGVTGTPTYAVVTAPTNGSLDLDTTNGQWTYTPTSDTFNGTDTFTLKATGATSGVDQESVAVTVGVDPTLPENYALDFDGTNDHVSIADANSLDLTNTFSIEAWINPDVVTGSQTILGKDGSYAFALNGTGLRFTTDSATLNATGVTIAAGAWTHVAVVFDSAQDATFYVNGVSKGTIAGADNANVTAGDINIGRLLSSGTGSNYFGGQIEDVRVWSTARSATEIGNNFDRQLNGAETGLVGYWNFNEGSGVVAKDGSGNANDGAIISGAAYENLVSVPVHAGATYKGLILGEDPDGDNLSYSNLSDPANGTVTLSGNTFTYVNNGTTGDDTFTVDITDEHNVKTAQTITMAVTDLPSTNVHAGALQLDGVNDFVDLADVTGAQLSGAVTIEAWVNFNKFSSFARIVNLSNGNDGTNNIAHYISGTTGKIAMNIFNGASLNLIRASTVLATDTWYHVAGVTDGTNGAIYINGVAQNLDALIVNGGGTTNPGATSAALIGATSVTRTTNYIGAANEGGTTFMDGQIDEVRIWNDARTAGEIKDNYTRQLTGNETDLNAYYRFDDDATQTTIKDLSPNANDGTLTNGASLVKTLGKAMNFDGVDDKVTIDGGTLVMTNAFTIETWIKTSDIDGNLAIENTILAKHAGSAAAGLKTFFVRTDGLFAFVQQGNTTFTSTTDVADGNWHHVAATYNGTDTMKLFVDGVRETTASLTGGNALIADITSSNIILGLNQGSQFFGGQMNDFRMWSVERSETDIADNYNQTLTGTETGLAAHYLLDEIVSTNKVDDTAGTNAQGTVSGGAAIVDTAPDIFGTTMTIAADEAAMGEMTTTDVTGTAAYSVSGGTASNGVSTKSLTNGTISIDQSSGAWVYTPNAKFDGTQTFTLTATGGTVTDTETITITVTDPDPQVAGGSLQFDGANDFVALTNKSNSLDVGNTGTIEFWMAPTVWNLSSGTTQDLLSIGRSGSTNGALYLSLQDNVGLHLRYGGGSETNNKFLNYQSSDSFTDGSWHHVAASWSREGSTTLKLYVDGNLVDTDTTALVINDTDPNWTLGKGDATDNQAYKGQMDEVRIWSTARTDGEIKDNYNQQLAGTETGLKAYYQLNDIKGTVVQDKTTNNNDGVIDGGSGGPIGNVLSLNGVTQYFSVVDTAELDVTSNFTLETWINLNTISGRQRILDKNLDYGFGVDNGKLLFTANGTQDLLATNAHVSAGEWTHVAVVFDSNQDANFYVNGALVQTVAGSTAIDVSNRTMDIGQLGFSGNTEEINGFMDNVRIWNDVRTAAELADGMTRTFDYNEAGLVAQYTFDDATGTTNGATVHDTAHDGHTVATRGNASDGTLVNGSIVDGGGGDARFINIPDEALSFDGANDSVTFAASVAPTGTAARTFMLWAKPSSTSNMSLFNYGNPAVQGQFFNFGINVVETSAGFGKGLQLNFASADVSYQPFTDPSDGQWHHYAITMAAGANTDQVKIYQDGVLLTGITGEFKNPFTTVAVNTGAGNLKLGEAGTLDYNGQM